MEIEILFGFDLEKFIRLLLMVSIYLSFLDITPKWFYDINRK
jgi:hypothetical protein